MKRFTQHTLTKKDAKDILLNYFQQHTLDPAFFYVLHDNLLYSIDINKNKITCTQFARQDPAFEIDITDMTTKQLVSYLKRS